MISLTSIIGPPLMTGLFSLFSSGKAGIIFPGAAFFAGGVFSMLSLFFAYKALGRIKD